jgi:hypothetical protein
VIGAAPLPQIRQRQLDGRRVRHFGAFLDGDFRCCADLAAETAHDKKPHDYFPLAVIVVVRLVPT